jgi:hypothetical protein
MPKHATAEKDGAVPPLRSPGSARALSLSGGRPTECRMDRDLQEFRKGRYLGVDVHYRVSLFRSSESPSRFASPSRDARAVQAMVMRFFSHPPRVPAT